MISKQLLNPPLNLSTLLSHVRLPCDGCAPWSVWVDHLVIERQSLQRPGPEIVLYGFCVMSSALCSSSAISNIFTFSISALALAHLQTMVALTSAAPNCLSVHTSSLWQMCFEWLSVTRTLCGNQTTHFVLFFRVRENLKQGERMKCVFFKWQLQSEPVALRLESSWWGFRGHCYNFIKQPAANVTRLLNTGRFHLQTVL